MHAISLGNSGIGKTCLQEKAEELIPEEDKVEITTLSESALYYFEQWELQSKKLITKTLAQKTTTVAFGLNNAR